MEFQPIGSTELQSRPLNNHSALRVLWKAIITDIPQTTEHMMIPFFLKVPNQCLQATGFQWRLGIWGWRENSVGIKPQRAAYAPQRRKITDGQLQSSTDHKAPLLFFLCPLYHPLLLTEPSNTKLLTHETFLANHSKNGYIGNVT